jgi:predicted transcriptional regulator
MEVVRVLWEIGRGTVRAVHEILVAQREIDFATVQTYLRRLEKKGYASSKLDNRVRVYTARTKARTVIRDTVDDLVERLFGGNSMPLVRHLIEDRGMSENDLSELREMINRLEDSSDQENRREK